ncbi:GNAT family N-acetyltransferase [Streptosporangium sp. CA-135522]|uniref:GNAT family N-acetyltransferase n=1 Tax=Streptosporangium sp. CA-135522 TaxID=3240072 RepID=UPI003D8A4F5E
MTAPEEAVRRLGYEDFAGCLRLAQDRGWPAEYRAWDLLFALGEVYGIDDPAGGLAATVALARHGDTLTTVGGLLVARRHGRRGLGERLMRHATERAGTPSIWLTATEYGRRMYAGLGYRTTGTCTRYAGRLRPDDLPGHRSRKADRTDLPGIIALDTEVFGADRTGLMTYLFSAAEQIRLVEGPAGVRGFAGLWRGVDSAVIGPLVAESPDVAAALLSGLAPAVEGPVRIDLDGHRPKLRAWLEEHGLREGDDTTVMVRGDDLPGDRTRLFTPVTGAIG